MPVLHARTGEECPTFIDVGQYQYDVSQGLLVKKLDMVVEG